jgi:fatty acid desaturase
MAIPGEFTRRAALTGMIVSGVLLHNYSIVRASHLAHHGCGREDRHLCLFDHRDQYPTLRTYIWYYTNLLGRNYFDYIPAGFIFLASRSFFESLYFKMRLPSRKLVAFSQIFVVMHAAAALVLASSPLSTMVAYVMFAVYWGMSQNVSHYGLAIGGEKAVFASRTYAVGRVVHFLFFGSVFSHLEHHVMPRVPGVLLADKDVAISVAAKVGSVRTRHFGLGQYARHITAQLQGPYPALENWRDRAA